MNQEKIVLANYYGLNSDEIYLLKTGVMNLEQKNDMSMICGGDWNLVLENIDK